MTQANREVQLVNALSGLVDNYYEIHSNEENCPACGNEYIADTHGLTPSIHDETCPLAIAIKLIAPSLDQDTGITPEILREQLNRYRQEFPGVLDITSPTDIDGVIIFTPDYSWYFGIHGENPEWDGNGYLDWNMHTTGRDDSRLDIGYSTLYLDEYLGMGVANDSKGWSLEKMVAKIAQVVLTREIQQDLSGPIVAPCTYTCVHDAAHFCHDNCPRCEMLWVSQMERDHNTQ